MIKMIPDKNKDHVRCIVSSEEKDQIYKKLTNAYLKIKTKSILDKIDHLLNLIDESDSCMILSYEDICDLIDILIAF